MKVYLLISALLIHVSKQATTAPNLTNFYNTMDYVDVFMQGAKTSDIIPYSSYCSNAIRHVVAETLYVASHLNN